MASKKKKKSAPHTQAAATSLPPGTQNVFQKQLDALPKRVLSAEEQIELVHKLFTYLPDRETLKAMEIRDRVALSEEVAKENQLFCYGYMQTFMGIMTGRYSQEDVLKAIDEAQRRGSLPPRVMGP